MNRFPKPSPLQEKLLLSAAVAAGTLLAYYVWFGRRNRSRRKELESELVQARKTVRDLEEQLLVAEQDEAGKGKEIRIWMDGAFDMMHFGHMNAFRQGKSLGTYLIVGVNSDETITACKGCKPVNSDEERAATVRACRWVDEVVPGVPYIMTEEYLLDIIERYKIDYVVHGDDPCIVNGKDVYESAVKLGKYLTIPRTEGISTTDIVGRMLLMTRSHHEAVDTDKSSESVLGSAVVTSATEKGRSNFLTTSRTIRLFGAGNQAPKKDSKIVYLAGSWDMFHAGHATILERARQYGDYVIVGVYNDRVVNEIHGLNLPILTMQERVLSVLGCKWVDDVLLDAPYILTRDMISSLRISVVLKGSVGPSSNPDPSLPDPFAAAAEMGILQQVDASWPITVHEIVRRIQSQQDALAKKFVAKHAQEMEYYSKKYGHPL